MHAIRTMHHVARRSGLVRYRVRGNVVLRTSTGAAVRVNRSDPVTIRKFTHRLRNVQIYLRTYTTCVRRPVV